VLLVALGVALGYAAATGNFRPAWLGNAAAADAEVIVITVRLPADAILEIDGHRTKETGETRTFETPPLAVGSRYTYTLKATSNGKEVTRPIHIAHGVDNTFDLRAEFRPAAKDKAHPKDFNAGGGAGPTGVSRRHRDD
jgi:uncharacterized protein (TIGR03000 family)